MTPPPLLSKEQIFHDIEAIYQKAFADNQWRIALRAKELQCKILGLLSPRRPGKINRISEMTDDEIRNSKVRLEGMEPDLEDRNHEEEVPPPPPPPGPPPPPPYPGAVPVSPDYVGPKIWNGYHLYPMEKKPFE